MCGGHKLCGRRARAETSWNERTGQTENETKHPTRLEEARRIIEEYANDLREIIKKPRERRPSRLRPSSFALSSPSPPLPESDCCV